MKQLDFDRLKAACEKEGFELLTKDSIHWMGVDYIALSDKKKDIWEGVEFFEASGSVHPLLRIERSQHRTVVISMHIGNTTERQWLINYCKPSTELAYVEQLKAEAFKRFGEIKEGDKFHRDFVPNKESEVLPVGLNEGFPLVFNYYKDQDALTFGGVGIYMAGKWAIRVPERVEVKWVDWSWAKDLNNINLEFSIKHIDWTDVKDKDEVGDFLASQLEKYLNGEIK